MIIFNRHYKKTKLITFSLALVYTLFPFIIPTDVLLNIGGGYPIFLSWNLFAFLLLFTTAGPALSISFLGVFMLLLWFLLYHFMRFVFWVGSLFNKK